MVVIEGFVPWEALPETGGALDPPVRPLVAALNALPWAHTVFSCAGHPEEPDAGARGRRQAHVDVLVADAARWRAFVRRVRRTAPAAAGAPRGRRPLGAPPLGPPLGSGCGWWTARLAPLRPGCGRPCAGSTSGMARAGGRRGGSSSCRTS